MPPITAADAELLVRFEDQTLPFDQWTHRMHVRIAYLYLQANEFEAAVSKMRAGIQAYNAANHVPEGPTSGYNETTTVAFMRLIHAVMMAYAQTFPTPDSESFCETHPQLMSRHALRFFYSPARRMLPEAKSRFIEPDLAPLPQAQP